MNKYNTAKMNSSQAEFIIEKISLTSAMAYPDDALEFKDIFQQIYTYLVETGLTDSEIYMQMDKKLKNMNFLFTDSQLSKNVFIHMKDVLDTHGLLIKWNFGHFF